MRILWFSCVPVTLDSNEVGGGWVASLRRAVLNNIPDVELGIAFEHSNPTFRIDKGGVAYYPLSTSRNLREKLQVLFDYDAIWKILRPQCLEVIENFKPDIIQCFGSEWPYGLIAAETNIPVVVHMQGFVHVYSMSGRMVYRLADSFRYHHYNPIKMLHYFYRDKKTKKILMRERSIMESCKYFLGRTEWDANIVKYFNPNAEYFHCEEAIRSEIINSTCKWSFHKHDKMKIISISSASALKGNELILRTAKLLKEMNFNFEWRIAGGKDSFNFAEKTFGLNHELYNITLIGKIEASQVAEELCQADVFVQSSIIDNSPNSLCEAQLIGTPVVSTFVGGIPQLVENGATGLFYPYNEPYTLAFLLMNLFANPELMKSLSKNEIEVSSRRHDDSAIANQLKSAYTRILKMEGK